VIDLLAGKRTARLDLSTGAGRHTFTGLLRHADVLMHGLRADALDRLGFGWEQRQAIRPDLVDVSLTAYGWTGRGGASLAATAALLQSCPFRGDSELGASDTSGARAHLLG
jgi:crotonobetainyl-CoA:carnitine CoA-transferase CaiB-like acyl-CoA transferase